MEGHGKITAPFIGDRLRGGLTAASSGAVQAFSRRSLRQQLVILVLAATLPLLAASALMFKRLVDNERSADLRSLVVNARTLAALVENEIDAHVAMGTTLSRSTALQASDLAAFSREAAQAIEFVPGSWISLSSPDGQILASTLAPLRTEWPRHSAPDVIQRGFATRRPQVGDMIFGNVSKRWTAFVEVPVFRNDTPLYSISISLSPDRFHAMLRKQFTRGEVVAIVDRNKNFVARIPDHDARVGTRSSEGWRSAMARSAEGSTRNQTVEGDWSVTGYAATSHGWTAGIAQLESDLAVPLRSILWTGLLAAAVLTLLSLGMAGLIARHASKGITDLAANARRLGRAEPIVPHPAPFVEAKTITDALVTARNELERRAGLLSAANCELESKVALRTSELTAEIRRREETETTLRQAQKMDAIGQLTGGIAHDFNNMLTIIMGNLDTVKRRLSSLDSGATLEKPIEAALAGSRSAAKLTHRLLAFSRQQPLEPATLNLNTLVSGLSDMLTRTVGEHIKIETVLGAGLWPVFADANQLENSLLNLVINARDAMPNGGKLTIETGNAYLDEAYAARFGDLKAGQYAVLIVSDTGTGIAANQIDKVFEPFFTTKAIGTGTGLGLAMVHGFVRQSGGHVRIYSEMGQGTAVKLYLPRCLKTGEMPAAPRGNVAAVEVPSRAVDGETVLLVEDDGGVLEYSREALEDLGYRVLGADSGEAALELLSRTGRIDLLFTDVVLGGSLSGRQLADEIGKLRPTLPVLFTTGYTRNAIVHGGMLDAGVNLLGKPYTQRELAVKIRTVLTNARSQPTG